MNHAYERDFGRLMLTKTCCCTRDYVIKIRANLGTDGKIPKEHDLDAVLKVLIYKPMVLSLLVLLKYIYIKDCWSIKTQNF